MQFLEFHDVLHHDVNMENSSLLLLYLYYTLFVAVRVLLKKKNWVFTALTIFFNSDSITTDRLQSLNFVLSFYLLLGPQICDDVCYQH
jgi:hypothetical protein